MPSLQLHSEGPSHFTFSGDYSMYQNSVDQHLSASFGHQPTGDERTTDRTSSFGAQGSYFHIIHLSLGNLMCRTIQILAVVTG